jgi:hypothetical protein
MATVSWDRDNPTHQVRHICKAHKADALKPTLQKSLPCSDASSGHILLLLDILFKVSHPKEGRTYNMGIAKMQADGSRVSAFVFQFGCISSLTL